MGTPTDPNRDPGASGTEADGTDSSAMDDAEGDSGFEAAVTDSAGSDERTPPSSSDHDPSSSSDPDGEQ